MVAYQLNFIYVRVWHCYRLGIELTLKIDVKNGFGASYFFSSLWYIVQTVVFLCVMPIITVPQKMRGLVIGIIDLTGNSRNKQSEHRLPKTGYKTPEHGAYKCEIFEY